MILIDTSAWIEFLRDTGSPVCNRAEALLESEIAICDAIRMEVLAGARNERHLHSLRWLLARAVLIPTPSRDYVAMTREMAAFPPYEAKWQEYLFQQYQEEDMLLP